MPINKPYFRIARHKVRDESLVFCDYALDKRYADDMSLLCRAYRILEKEMKEVFEYVEPCDDNLHVFSHKIYDLLLRAATEFETNCKEILKANDYNMSRNLNIEDYYKINKATKLSEYEVHINTWRPFRKLFRPFQNWETDCSLSWYQGYNSVKHNRSENFNKASLENSLNALSGLFCVLFAQFGVYSYTAHQIIPMCSFDDEGGIYVGDSIFSIKPSIWPIDEKYDFDWDVLAGHNEPFQKYNFDIER